MGKKMVTLQSFTILKQVSFRSTKDVEKKQHYFKSRTWIFCVIEWKSSSKGEGDSANLAVLWQGGGTVQTCLHPCLAPCLNFFVTWMICFHPWEEKRLNSCNHMLHDVTNAELQISKVKFKSDSYNSAVWNISRCFIDSTSCQNVVICVIYNIYTIEQNTPKKQSKTDIHKQKREDIHSRCHKLAVCSSKAVPQVENQISMQCYIFQCQSIIERY